MKKLNITKRDVGNAIKNSCGLMVTVAAFVLPNLSMIKEIIEEVRYNGNATYSDVINVVLHSNMYSTDKTKLAAMVPKDKDSEFYKFIIKVVKSNIYSSDKVTVIKSICEKEEA